MRCRHAFEYVCVHANGDVVCSIIDGRGDFVLGNIYQQSIREIFRGPRASELRRLVLSTTDEYCPAIGKSCPLKNVPSDPGEQPDVRIRFLGIEPTTACDLRCLCCPVRDFAGDVTWREAYADGGASFLLWDAARRGKQHAADYLRRTIPVLANGAARRLGRGAATLLRGRIPKTRTGTLPLEVLKRVVDEAGGAVGRVDMFNYGEPFLYRHVLEALRHIRAALPTAEVAISTDGLQLKDRVEAAIVDEELLDWLVVSIDGCDEDTYRRYRIRGDFNAAFANLVRLNRRARGSRVRVVWQYVVFRWNDRDAHFRRALSLAEEHDLHICFDFAHTWGRSRRTADELRYLTRYLKPFTALPGEPRHGGW